MPKRNKIDKALLGKKIICNPPVAAAVDGLEGLMAAGLLTDEDVKEAIACDEEFVGRYKGIFDRAIGRLS